MRDLNRDVLHLRKRACGDGSHGTRRNRRYALPHMANTFDELGYRGLRARTTRKRATPRSPPRQPAARVLRCGPLGDQAGPAAERLTTTGTMDAVDSDWPAHGAAGGASGLRTPARIR